MERRDYRTLPLVEVPMIASQDVSYHYDLPKTLNHPFLRWPEARAGYEMPVSKAYRFVQIALAAAIVGLEFI